ncbi:MAG: 16S rRNA (guanine(966)-N(2))-methyltransferase RsmD [Acidimicrobiia bacterium]
MSAGVRVIAGEFRGRRLRVPAGIRPTGDRVREAIFSAVGNRLHDGVVLDGYSGTGAFSIESLSRGAYVSVAVEQDARVAKVLAENVALVDLGDRVRVERRDVERFVAAAPPAEAPFDLVFLDPPYDVASETVERVLHALAAPGWLQPDAMVVVERSSRSREPVLPTGWEIHWLRTYGDTLVLMATTPR